jgi:hypothetical protein
MIFELKLVYEVQKYTFFLQFLGKIKHFRVKIKHRILDMVFSTEQDVKN